MPPGGHTSPWIFGSTSNLKTIHQTQSPCTVTMNSGCGEHFTFFPLVAKALKMQREDSLQEAVWPLWKRGFSLTGRGCGLNESWVRKRGGPGLGKKGAWPLYTYLCNSFLWGCCVYRRLSCDSCLGSDGRGLHSRKGRGFCHRRIDRRCHLRQEWAVYRCALWIQKYTLLKILKGTLKSNMQFQTCA